MFGIGFWEMIVIGGLILVAVGPDRLPEMLKQAAKFYRQFRRTADDVRASTGIDQMLRDEELKELAELRKQRLDLLGTGKAPGKPTAVKTPAPAAGGSVVKPAPKAVPPTAASDTLPASALPEGETIPAKKGALGPAAKNTVVRGLDSEAREREAPHIGVDLSEARIREPAPPPKPVAPEHVHPSKAALFAEKKPQAEG